MIVRYEDGKWINNIGVYFEMLKELNDNLNILIQMNPEYNSKIEVMFFNIIDNINRLFPIRRSKINFSDGILKLEKYFDFLKNDYKNIFSSYKKELNMLNDMRNKFEHVPHVIKWKTYVGDTKYKKMIFINDEYNMDIIEGNTQMIEIRKNNKECLEWKIDTDIIMKIIILLDEIFIKIQNKLENYFHGNTTALNHPYIKSILDINFKKYINGFVN